MTSECVATKPALTEDVALNAIQGFFREKPFLVFGTGMSCALDESFGMAALRDELLQRMKDCALNGEQEKQWAQVEQALCNGCDLESALDNVTEQDLLHTITAVTGYFVASLDREYAFRIARGDAKWPATSFIKRLVETLPEGDRILHVLTPNYDMLFEYACERAAIAYTNGFSGGVERRTDWDAADRALWQPEQICQPRRRLTTQHRHRKHARLYKVHGSINYFFHENAVIENNAWMWNPPDFAQRVIITPGLAKYQTLQSYRLELLSKADAEIERASHFLFLGYGFGDTHLEEYIKRKLITQGCAGLIITRDSNPRIEALLAQAAGLWLVCKAEAPQSNGTRIYNRQYSDWVALPDRMLWDIAEFTTQVLGG